MSNGVLVSIVLPTYNGAKYLANAIDSCIAQEYTNWELILVDDASTDATPAIIDRYVRSDDRIRSIRNPVNLKLPKALNVGFSSARGQLLGWIAGDDAYRPGALNRITSVMGSNPDVDVVCTDYTVIDEDGVELEAVTAGEPECLPVRNGVGPCRFYRRRVHEELGGYDETLFLVEDYDFLLRAFCQFRLYALHEDLYLFRSHAGGLTSTHAAAVPLARDRMKEKNLPQLKEKNSRLAVECQLSLVRSCLSRQEAARARRHAIGSLREAPVDALRSGGGPLVAALVGPVVTKALLALRGRRRRRQ